MKTKIVLTMLTLGASAFIVNAQDFGGPPPEGGQGGGGHRHHPPPLPLVLALDANHDGVIDADEIANASAALKTLDKNGDGQLTRDEYLPTPPADAPKDAPRPPSPAIVKALDANGDGIIDATEIANAPAVLKTLDKNGDGKLTREEYIGPRPHHRTPGNGTDPANGQNPSEDVPPGPPTEQE